MYILGFNCKKTYKHECIYLSTSLTFCPELENFFIPPFTFYIFRLQVLYSTTTCKVASFITFPLITNFIHHITEYPQFYMKQEVPILTRMKSILYFFPSYSSSPWLFKAKRTSFQPGCVGRRSSNEWRPYHAAEVSRRITLCLNSPARHHKQDAYGWLTFFHTALAQGEYFFSHTYKQIL